MYKSCCVHHHLFTFSLRIFVKPFFSDEFSCQIEQRGSPLWSCIRSSVPHLGQREKSPPWRRLLTVRRLRVVSQGLSSSLACYPTFSLLPLIFILAAIVCGLAPRESERRGAYDTTVMSNSTNPNPIVTAPELVFSPLWLPPTVTHRPPAQTTATHHQANIVSIHTGRHPM